MPHFFNPSQHYYISTSFKVMYTLLYHAPSLQRVSNQQMQLYTVQRFIYYRRIPHFLLVRNPYERLESFYKDKFRQVPLARLMEYGQLQQCQRIFCPFLHISPVDTAEVIREKLLALSFAHFIELLPQVYQLDGHLHPQHMITRIYYRGIPISPIKIDKILQVEFTDDRHYLQEKLGIDLTQKLNHTAAIPLEVPWSPRLRSIVNQLYHADFKRLGYEQTD